MAVKRHHDHSNAYKIKYLIGVALIVSEVQSITGSMQTNVLE